MERLNDLSYLVAQRNEISKKIHDIMSKPAQLGHVGEFIASIVFDIKLESLANNPAFDGTFHYGILKGKTVDIKTYSKHERILDLSEKVLPDYYLVLAGPPPLTPKIKGEDRPWIIDRVHLFEAEVLVTALRERGIKYSGRARSIANEYWDKSEIYPNQECGLIVLDQSKRDFLAKFGRVNTRL